MRLTPEKILEALRSNYEVRGAATQLGVSDRALRDMCARFGLGKASDHVMDKAAYGARLLLNAPKVSESLTKLLERAARDATLPRSIIVCPDTHRPFHDRDAHALFEKVCREMRPDMGVIIGDYLDCYSISFHPKSPERRANLKAEIDDGLEGLDSLQATGIRRWMFCEGNHEFRLERYLEQKAPELYGLLGIRELLRIDERGWDWVPYKKWKRVGKIAFSHEVGHAGKTAGQRSLDEFGGNIVFGHSHRGSVTYGGTVDGEKHVALNVGWLGDLESIDYTHQSKTRGWQHGFGWVDLDTEGNGYCQFIPIVDGRCCVRGEWIGL